jgi:hypothetical protein
VKQLQGTAATQVAAPAAECVALLAAVDRYPTWYPEVVRRVEVVERDGDGKVAKARALLHVVYGPLVKDFNLLLQIGVADPATVILTRLANERSDPERFEVRWHVSDGAQRRIELRLDANLSVPRLLPVGGIGDGLAHGFVAAAAKALGASG